jgi:hypothetical protein
MFRKFYGGNVNPSIGWARALTERDYERLAAGGSRGSLPIMPAYAA